MSGGRNEPENGSSRARPGRLATTAVGAGLWVASGNGLQSVFRLAVLSVLARLLGPHDFGLVAAAMVVISFFQIILRTGVRPALVQLPVLTDRHISTGFWLSVGVGVGMSLVVALSAYPLSTFVFAMPELAPLLAASCLLLPLQGLAAVPMGLLERELRFSWIIRMDLAAYIVGNGIVGITLALLGFGAWALIAAYVVAEAVRSVIALAVQPHAKRLYVDTAAARDVAVLGGGFALGRAGNWGALYGDKWVVGRWLGQESLGLYKYAFELTSMVVNVFAQVLDNVLFPAMAKVQLNRVALGRAYRQGIALIAIFVLPMSVALTILAPELIHLILGPGWEQLVAPFRVLSAAMLIRGTYKISDSLARATGAVYRRAWRQAAFAGSVLILSFIGLRWGTVGVAYGVVAAIAVNFLLMAQLSVTVAGVSWRDIAIAHLGALPAVAVFSGALSVATYFARMAVLPDAAVIAAGGAAGAGALALFVRYAPAVALGRLGDEVVMMLMTIISERIPWMAALYPARGRGA